MKRPTLTRALRIAWTAFWGFAAVLLIALWVRSYWWEDVVTKFIDFRRAFTAYSYKGEFELYIDKPMTYVSDWKWWCIGASGKKPISGFHYSHWSEDVTIAVPQPFIIAVVAMTTALPWMHRSSRFSLRTLLVATTLVAVMLGLVVWATH